MTCRSCTEARASAKASVRAIVRGHVRTAAAQAKEAAGHVADKLKGASDADEATAAPADGTTQQTGDKAPG